MQYKELFGSILHSSLYVLQSLTVFSWNSQALMVDGIKNHAISVKTFVCRPVLAQQEAWLSVAAESEPQSIKKRTKVSSTLAIALKRDLCCVWTMARA